MKRDVEIDIIKGLAIILMVTVHALMEARGSALGGFAHAVCPTISYFHMPVFFMVAGWTWKHYKPFSFDACASFLVKRVNRLYFVYVFWMCAFVVLHNAFVDLNFYTEDQRILEYMSGRFSFFVHPVFKHSYHDILYGIRDAFLMRDRFGDQMIGPIWFLRAMFFSSIVYWISSTVILRFYKRASVIVMTIFSVALIFIGKYLWPMLPGHLKYVINLVGGVQMLTGVFLLHLGVLIKKASPRFDRVLLKIGVCGLLLLICLRIGCALLGSKGTLLAWNRFPSISFLTLSSVAGWMLLGSIARILKSSPLSTIFSYVGRHTMPILILHFLAFRLINMVGVHFHGAPRYLIAVHSTTYVGVIWTPIYVAFGIAFPLFLNECFHRILLMLRNCKEEVR